MTRFLSYYQLNLLNLNTLQLIITTSLAPIICIGNYHVNSKNRTFNEALDEL